MKDSLDRYFRDHFGLSPEVIARAPGRVNLIGEHTDYNDGFVLPCAISRSTMVAACARDDGRFRLVSADLGGAAAEFSGTELHVSAADTLWTNYVRGMIDGLLLQGADLKGADIAIMGDMPQGTGLSSSAALENASGLALAALGGMGSIDRGVLARLGQRTEHEFAGCNCGIMDQLVSAMAQEGSALLIDCRSLETRAVRIAEDWAILIVQSGIERGLVEGKYNSRREQCELAAAHFGVRALRDLEVAPEEAVGLDPVAFRRARHVITENARTLSAAEALGDRDIVRFGGLTRESHSSMRDDFEMSMPAIDRLQQILSDSIGAAGGARLTGGGFGGAVVAILPSDKVAHVKQAVLADYRTPAGGRPLIIEETPSAGAGFL